MVMDNKLLIPSKIDSVKVSGKLRFYYTPVSGIKITKTFYPSMEERFLVEEWEIENISNKSRTIQFSNIDFAQGQLGFKGNYSHRIFSAAQDSITLAPKSAYTFPIYYGATLNDEKKTAFNYEKAKKQRQDFLDELYRKLGLNTPNAVINTLFYFSKIRTAESIFDSSMGLVHSPGGGNYTGVWANDQVEYSGPFFPSLGYTIGKIAAFNGYKKFLEHIPEDDTHIPYAFEVDGIFALDHLDRGDAAMIAYGTSHYLLSNGNKEKAQELWPLVEWSINYCHKMRNEEGAVRSESDEMEGRIETGTANLATSTLYYGGLKYAARLAKELGKIAKAKLYQRRATVMEQVIENYFGSSMEGLETYKYNKENKLLRHGIYLPLAMGINTRKEATLEALFEKLWTENGIMVELNPEVPKESALFWDRATLNALRGAMRAGEINLAYDKLNDYSQKHLLGNHVPYAMEAFPENNMMQLSTESALYCRIITEGLLGIEPLGFKTTQLSPGLPEGWSFLTLKNIYISGKPMDVSIEKKSDKLLVHIRTQGRTVVEKAILNGEKIIIKFL
jgi:hypothetical protein